MPEYQWDVFISHASEDKETIARPLAEQLGKEGLRVWLDANELTLGDSLRRKIDHGLVQSRYGVVILSPAFFSKEWPQNELNGLFALESRRNKVILPVWHQVDQNFIARYSPLLADRLEISTSLGLERVGDAVRKAIQEEAVSPSVPLRSLPPRKKIMIPASLTILLVVIVGVTWVILRSPRTRQRRPGRGTERPPRIGILDRGFPVCAAGLLTPASLSLFRLLGSIHQ
jgi:hypothetical protein